MVALRQAVDKAESVAWSVFFGGTFLFKEVFGDFWEPLELFEGFQGFFFLGGKADFLDVVFVVFGG